jgi:putative tricarboxylic transport membrane protein
METVFDFWLAGLGVALMPANLLFAFIGCVIGTLVGVLPGLGPAGAMAILLPLTFNLGPVPAIIMLSAIYYGTQYGGTITSVLINVPGESTSVVTCFDGHPLAKQGRAGAALGIAAIASVVAGITGTVALMALALPLASLGLRFGPVEMFGVLALGLTMVVSFRGSSLLAGLAMTLFGLMLGMVGVDPVHGAPRFTFGSSHFFDGVQLVPVIMGLFGIAEILSSLEERAVKLIKTKLSSLLPRRDEAAASAKAIGRGTAIGFLIGLIPGVAGVVPTFMAYALEKRLSKHPENFGHGALEGVAVAESANNAHAQGTMVPLLTLGIPGTASLAVMMGAFMINGITPGPFLFRDHPQVVWPVIASFLVGNVMLFVLNFPLVGLWVHVLRIPRHILFVLILVFCIIGAYALRQDTTDVQLMLVFGVLGYILRKIDWPAVPLVIALILGPMMEKALRAGLELSAGDFSVFLTNPISGMLLAAAAVTLGTALWQQRTRGKARGITKPIFQQGDIS